MARWMSSQVKAMMMQETQLTTPHKRAWSPTGPVFVYFSTQASCFVCSWKIIKLHAANLLNEMISRQDRNCGLVHLLSYSKIGDLPWQTLSNYSSYVRTCIEMLSVKESPVIKHHLGFLKHISCHHIYMATHFAASIYHLHTQLVKYSSYDAFHAM